MLQVPEGMSTEQPVGLCRRTDGKRTVPNNRNLVRADALAQVALRDFGHTRSFGAWNPRLEPMMSMTGKSRPYLGGDRKE
jgi:hypothetical protein